MQPVCLHTDGLTEFHAFVKLLALCRTSSSAALLKFIEVVQRTVQSVHKSLQINVQILEMLYIRTEQCGVCCNTVGVLGSWH